MCVSGGRGVFVGASVVPKVDKTASCSCLFNFPKVSSSKMGNASPLFPRSNTKRRARKSTHLLVETEVVC